MTNFDHCPLDILTHLFLSSSTSFYGSSSWKLSELSLFPLKVAWRKCIKRIWKLSVLTRSMSAICFHQNSLQCYYLVSWISITPLLTVKTVLYTIARLQTHGNETYNSLTCVSKHFQMAKAQWWRAWLMIDDSGLTRKACLNSFICPQTPHQLKPEQPCFHRDGLVHLGINLSVSDVKNIFHVFTL